MVCDVASGVKTLPWRRYEQCRAHLKQTRGNNQRCFSCHPSFCAHLDSCPVPRRKVDPRELSCSCQNITNQASYRVYSVSKNWAFGIVFAWPTVRETHVWNAAEVAQSV